MLGIDDAIASVSSLVKTVVTRIWPDASEAERQRAEQLAAELSAELQLLLLQIQLNQTEAQHPNLFVSGWRPFIGWLCGIALAYAAIIEPFARFLAVVVWQYDGPFPRIDTDITLQILLGLLGLAGMRSFEKSRQVARMR